MKIEKIKATTWKGHYFTLQIKITHTLQSSLHITVKLDLPLLFLFCVAPCWLWTNLKIYVSEFHFSLESHQWSHHVFLATFKRFPPGCTAISQTKPKQNARVPHTKPTLCLYLMNFADKLDSFNGQDENSWSHLSILSSMVYIH